LTGDYYPYVKNSKKRVFIYQNGIIGKVARVEPKELGNFDVGLKFITREEPGFTIRI